MSWRAHRRLHPTAPRRDDEADAAACRQPGIYGHEHRQHLVSAIRLFTAKALVWAVTIGRDVEWRPETHRAGLEVVVDAEGDRGVLGYPGAVLFSLDGDAIRETTYQDTKHFLVTRDFLNSPERFFKHLFAKPSDEGGDAA